MVVIIFDFMTVFLLPIVDGRSDGVFSQNRAVNFDRRQSQLIDDLGVFDGQSFIDRASFNPFCGQGRRCNGRSTAKAFEFGILDFSVIVHLDLELHDITTFWGTDDANPNIGAVFDVR